MARTQDYRKEHDMKGFNGKKIEQKGHFLHSGRNE